LIKILCMKWNWIIIALALFGVFFIMARIANRNRKDKKSLMREIENDYQVPKVNEPKI